MVIKKVLLLAKQLKVSALVKKHNILVTWEVLDTQGRREIFPSKSQREWNFNRKLFIVNSFAILGKNFEVGLSKREFNTAWNDVIKLAF